MGKIQITLPDTLEQIVREEANRYLISPSAVIRRIVAEHYDMIPKIEKAEKESNESKKVKETTKEKNQSKRTIKEHQEQKELEEYFSVEKGAYPS